jgi:hypothetical protein
VAAESRDSKPKREAPSPKQLERLTESVRAAGFVKKLANITPVRPAETYGKLRDDRSENQRLISHA